MFLFSRCIFACLLALLVAAPERLAAEDLPAPVLQARASVVSLRGKAGAKVLEATGVVVMFEEGAYLLVSQPLLFASDQVELVENGQAVVSCERLDAQLCREVPLARFSLRGRLGPLPPGLPPAKGFSAATAGAIAYLLASRDEIIRFDAATRPAPAGNGVFPVVGGDGVLQGVCLSGSVGWLPVERLRTWSYALGLDEQLRLLADALALPPQIREAFSAMGQGREAFAAWLQEYRRAGRQGVFQDPKSQEAMLDFASRLASALALAGRLEALESEAQLPVAKKQEGMEKFCGGNAVACERLAGVLAEHRQRLLQTAWLTHDLERQAKEAAEALAVAQQALGRTAARMRGDAAGYAL